LKQARRIELKSFAWKATGLRSGVTAIECGLIAAGIGVAILTVVNSVGGSLVAIFTTVSNDLPFAIAAGEIRDDISPEDLLRALVGMCYMHDQPGWQKNVQRLLDVFIDGLRHRSVTGRSKK
jgi:Flp pilus assembly pilin Flp